VPNWAEQTPSPSGKEYDGRGVYSPAATQPATEPPTYPFFPQVVIQVIVGPPYMHAEYDHLVAVRNIKMRRCQKLEFQAARQGYGTPPDIQMEIEDLHAEMDGLDRQINTYLQHFDTGVAQELNLASEQVAEIVKMVSREGCTDVQSTRVYGMFPGSIVMGIEIPLAGAARLLALHHIQHPQLKREGIVGVGLIDNIRTIDQAQINQLAEARDFEIQDLQGNFGDAIYESPYTIVPATIPLTVVIETT
jgi:hypothetical protein